MRFALMLVLTTLVATCGQKGPLELPGEQRSSSPSYLLTHSQNIGLTGRQP